MRLLIQQVKKATVSLPTQQIQRSIEKGMLIYLWIHKDDESDYQAKIEKIITKIPQLKCLSNHDEIGVSLQDSQEEVLLISNFTLFGRNHKGTKMDFIHSAPHQKAKEIYDYFIQKAKESWRKLQTGEFWAMMEIESINDGPINYVLDF